MIKKVVQYLIMADTRVQLITTDIVEAYKHFFLIHELNISFEEFSKALEEKHHFWVERGDYIYDCYLQYVPVIEIEKKEKNITQNEHIAWMRREIEAAETRLQERERLWIEIEKKIRHQI